MIVCIETYWSLKVSTDCSDFCKAMRDISILSSAKAGFLAFCFLLRIHVETCGFCKCADLEQNIITHNAQAWNNEGRIR